MKLQTVTKTCFKDALKHPINVLLLTLVFYNFSLCLSFCVIPQEWSWFPESLTRPCWPLGPSLTWLCLSSPSTVRVYCHTLLYMSAGTGLSPVASVTYSLETSCLVK